MKKVKKAFTLIELLIVVAIIGILATVVILNVAGARAKAAQARAKDDTNTVFKAVQTCIADGGTKNASGYTAGGSICTGSPESQTAATYPTTPPSNWTYSQHSGEIEYMDAAEIAGTGASNAKKAITCDSTGCSQNKTGSFDTSSWY